MFKIALYEPQIAPNTGNIIRLAANLGSELNLIGKLGFSLQEKQLRRAGLDYHDLTNVNHFSDLSSFLRENVNQRIFACTTKGSKNYSFVDYKAGDVFLFGSETSGLPDNVREGEYISEKIKIPMKENNRSLNLSNSVAVILYEAWRQNNFK